MKQNIILKSLALIACLLCSLRAAAYVDSYACYTPENTTLTFYYDDLRSSRTGTTYDLNEGDIEPYWFTDGTESSVTKVVFNSSFADARPTTTFRWFHAMGNLESITGLRYLNTSEVTNMRNMFAYCDELTSLDLSHFNTAKVTNMQGMFRDCSSLTNLDVSHFNTSKVTSMQSMFHGCSSLTNLNVSGFNTANVTDMQSMFHSCSSLTSLDLRNFNTSNVTNMITMLNGCSGLTSLDLSGFNTSKVTKMIGMFYRCTNLRTIYVGSGWSTAAVTDSNDMFRSCSSLVGGQGTTYDVNHLDVSYARIDGGPSNPGYFTDKNAAQPGDINGDGFVNVADVTELISLILNSTSIEDSLTDVNGDGQVNVADVTALIRIILNQ